MQEHKEMPTAAKVLAGGACLAASAYAAYVATTWLRYGTTRARPEDADTRLDAYIPAPEIDMRHHVRVQAPAEVAYHVACTNQFDSPVINGLFKLRETIFGRPTNIVEPPPGGLRETMRAFGWEILAEVPGREIVFGAAAQPWKRDVSFRTIPADDFASFAEPGYVKIAWTMRVEPIDPFACTVATETRVVTTDAEARTRFRRYWSFLSPGINIIRVAMLGQIKCAAETQAREAAMFAPGEID